MTSAIQKAKKLADSGKISKAAFEKMASDREAILKLALPWDLKLPAGKTVAKGLLAASAIPLVSIGAHFGLAALNSLIEKHRLNKSREQMFAIEPELAEIPKEQVDRAFSFLSHFAPSVAKNPIAAANFVKNLTLMPAMGDAGVVKGLVDIERGGPDSNSFFTHFVRGFGESSGKSAEKVLSGHLFPSLENTTSVSQGKDKPDKIYNNFTHEEIPIPGTT